jgi:Electron transfer DM13
MSSRIRFTRAVVLCLASIVGSPLLAQSFGPFAGESGHVTAGTATIVQEGGTYFVLLNADFSFDGAPDPKLALGNGKVDETTAMANLASNTGAQRYQLPAGVNPADYTTLHVWCEEFSVSLGVAPLN